MIRILRIAYLLIGAIQVLAVDPVVSNVQAKQREGSRLVDITYDVADPDSPTLTVYLKVSPDGGKTWKGALSTTEDVGRYVVPGTGKHIVWDGGKEMPNQYGTRIRYRVVVDDFPAPTNFVWIPPGTFLIGSPANEPYRPSYGGVEDPQQTVILTHGFWLLDHEVTQEEYQALLELKLFGHPGPVPTPSSFKGTANRPVEMVSWQEATWYCQMLTKREFTAGRITAEYAYRLPTEAEWEYAARAGSAGPQHGQLDDIAWWARNSGGQTHPVKQKGANSWGLYDMIGNVNEWTSDRFRQYTSEIITNPISSTIFPNYMFRGGSWGSNETEVRSAYRMSAPQDQRYPNTGFRPALSLVR